MPKPLVSHAVLASALLLATFPAQGQTESATGVTRYEADFFARVQPATAYDMIRLLPGFRLIEGDAAIRGYSGSGGNVLLDGQRPSSKEELLEDILKRIPASQVARIELLRSGAAGIDMQGYAIMANIVRAHGARLSGRLEAEYAHFRHGYTAPRAAGEFSYASGERSLDLTGALYREIDDEHGFGSRNRYAGDGSPVRLVDYVQAEGVNVAEATALYRQPLAGGAIRLNGLFKNSRMFADIVRDTRYPAVSHADGLERKHTRIREGGAHYERALGAGDGIELLGSYRKTVIHAVEASDGDSSLESSTGSETILRGVYRRHAGTLALEIGAEGAINVLDSANGLIENGAEVPLPNAKVRVEEKRAEFFATATWRLDRALTLEAGLRYEISRLSQTGDSSLRKSLAFLKPRALLTWSAGAHDTLRLLVEREVGQLDFADFAGAASLTSGTIVAGNADLEPDTLWRAEAAYERRFGSGSLVLTARREWIRDVVDRIPVFAEGEVFDAVGNIGSGHRDEAEANLTLPFDTLGAKGVTLTADVLLRRSRVQDPTTGATRRISDDTPLEAKAGFTYDLPRMHLHWGVNYIARKTADEYKIDEVQTDTLKGRLDAFVEYKPTTLWTFRLFAKNLTDSPAIRTRRIHTGLRGTAPLDYRERRVLRSDRYFGLTVQRNFGV